MIWFQAGVNNRIRNTGGQIQFILAPVFAETLKVWGPYLPHHWSDWPKILDLVLRVPKQLVYPGFIKI